MSEREFVAVAEVGDVPPGGKLRVNVGSTPVLLVSSGDTIHAVSAICSHAYESLEGGRCRAGWIACPVHGARFKLETGEPMNPPATQPIEVYEVRIVGETIEVAV